MLLFILVIACFQNISLQNVVKFKIPFEHLITLNSSNFVTKFDMLFNLADSQWFSQFCWGVDCYAAVFNDSNTINYQFFRSIPNDGSYTDTSFGLKFRKSMYMYSIAFLNENNKGTCMKSPDYLNFALPKCPNGWFGYRRTNGRLYCYYVTGLMSRKEGFVECNKLSKGANISGFQTDQERSYLHTEIFNRTNDRYVHIAAEISSYDKTRCEQEYPVYGTELKECYKSKFFWYDYVPLSGKAEAVQFQPVDNIDGAPAPSSFCLQIASNLMDDNNCDTPHAVLCGKYADG